MDFPVFISFFLALTVQSADLDTQAWSASPRAAVEQTAPLQTPITPVAADFSGEQPSRLPAILEEQAPLREIPNEAPLNLVDPQRSEGSPLPSQPNLAPATLNENWSTRENVAPRPITQTSHEASILPPPTATTPPAAPPATPPSTMMPRELPENSSNTNNSNNPVTSNDLEQLIKDSIAFPQQDDRIAGRPLRLLDVLSPPIVIPQPQVQTRQPITRQSFLQPSRPALLNNQATFTTAVLLKDPREEQERVLAYWQLAQSLGQYNLTQQAIDFWESISAQPGDEPLLRTARASAKSLLCEARVTLVADQHTLAEAADLVSEQGLPLPSDPPHVGTYFTHFDKLFAGKPAPAIGRRLNATLPLCREAVESRACSTFAAHNAVEMLAKEYAKGRCSFATLASAVATWQDEHRAFLRSAYVYNNNICQYVVSVAGLPADRETLVMMLIRPNYSVNPQTQQQPASGESPVVATPMTNGSATANGPAIMNNGYQAPRSAEQGPTLAPPIEDHSVRPASSELPVLESNPITTPATPTPNSTAPRFLPGR